jgi:hypothetical protein
LLRLAATFFAFALSERYPASYSCGVSERKGSVRSRSAEGHENIGKEKGVKSGCTDTLTQRL